MKELMPNVNFRIAGIPCQLQIDRVFVQEPMGPSADSDWDCYGYSEIDFTVCDRRGRPAPWLERKMTDSDRQDAEAVANGVVQMKNYIPLRNGYTEHCCGYSGKFSWWQTTDRPGIWTIVEHYTSSPVKHAVVDDFGNFVEVA